MQLFKSRRRRAPLFYGWVIVAVMATTAGISGALGAINFGLFMKPMGDQLGISRAMFGWAWTARQLAEAAVGPVLGRLIDRFGVRLLLPATVVVTASAMVGMAYVTQGWQMVVLFGAIGLVGLSRPGSLQISVPVTKWFVRKRGRALALTAIGVPIGAIVLMPLTQVLIDRFGWERAWIILAVMAAVILIPLSLIFVRRQPEDIGLVPDGVDPAVGQATPPGAAKAASMPSEEEASWTVSEAVRSAAFWRLAGVFSLVMFMVNAVGLHRYPYFMDRGIDPRLVALSISAEAVLGALGTLTIGYLVERFPARIVGAVTMTLLGISIFAAHYTSTALVMFLVAPVWGVSIGSTLLIRNYMAAEYFGRRYQGSIQGIINPITLVLSSIGGPLAGYVQDTTGNYGSIWLPLAGLTVLGAVVLGLSPPPRKISTAPPAAVPPQPLKERL